MDGNVDGGGRGKCAAELAREARVYNSQSVFITSHQECIICNVE